VAFNNAIPLRSARHERLRVRLEKQALKAEKKAERQRAHAERLASGIRGPILADPYEADGGYSHG
jgi:hypothetical protein